MVFDPKRVELHVHDANNVVASFENVLVQVRVGKMDLATLNRIESVARLLRTRHKSAVGAIGIVEDTAEITDPATRARQRQIMKSLLSDPRTYSVGVMPGDTLAAGLIRSFVRLLVMGEPRFYVAPDLLLGCAWLSEKLDDRSPEELIAFAEHVRMLARVV